MTEEQLRQLDERLDLFAYRLDRLAEILAELRALALRVREGRT